MYGHPFGTLAHQLVNKDYLATKALIFSKDKTLMRQSY